MRLVRPPVHGRVRGLQALRELRELDLRALVQIPEVLRYAERVVGVVVRHDEEKRLGRLATAALADVLESAELSLFVVGEELRPRRYSDVLGDVEMRVSAADELAVLILRRHPVEAGR